MTVSAETVAALRAAEDAVLGGVNTCPPLLPGLEPMRVAQQLDLVLVSGRELTRYGVPYPEPLLVPGWVDRLLHEHGIEHEHERPEE